MLKNWLKIYLHQIKNNKFFTFLNVLGLSIGIAGLVFSILYWNEEHSYNDWNPEKEKIFLSITDIGEGQFWASNVVAFEPYLKTDFPELESYCYLDNFYTEEIIQYKNKKEILSKVTDSQKDFFAFFPFKFSKGSAKNALADNGSISISEEIAKRLFGEENPIGKQVIYGKLKLIVRGVYKISGKSSLAPEVVVNRLESRMESDREQWGNFNYGLLLKLKNPADKVKVQKKLERLLFENRDLKWAKAEGISLEQWRKNGGRPTKITLESLEESRLHSVTDGFAEGRGNYQFLMIMMGLSVLILILSIVNYVNLATANAIKRAKEVGVRKVLGASKRNIVKQFIFETVITAVISILISLVIVELSLPYYNEFLSKDLVIHSSQFYLQIVIIFLTVIVFGGIFPAIYVSNFETLKVLRGNFSRSKNGIWLRNGMLVIQFAIASFFIIGSYIVYEQIAFMNSKDLGFNGDQVIQINYRNPYDYHEEGYLKRVVQRYETVNQELSKIQGVKGVGIGSFSFGSKIPSSSGFNYKDKSIQGKNVLIDFGMLDMLQLKLVSGRDISPKFSSDTVTSILLNETAAKLLGEKNPIGKEIDWNNKKLKIIGIVKDFHVNGPQDEIPPTTIFHYKTIDWMIQNAHSIYVKLDASNMEKSIAEIESFWTKKVDTEYPFKYDFLDKSFKRSYENYVNQKNLFSLLNLIVIMIALFGLFALASYSIQRRMKEIAIRKALGAEAKMLLAALSKQYVIFCIIGFLIALFPVYYLLDKWLENFAYRIDISAIPFLIGFFSLMILTLIVVLSRAYQATRVNVLKYLKYE